MKNWTPRFRVWDKNAKQFRDYLSLGWDVSNKYPYLITSEEEILYLEDGFVIQFSTGLKDKNGIEIFEGDILNDGDNFTSKVCFGERFEEGEVGFYLKERGVKEGELAPRTHSLVYNRAFFGQTQILGHIFGAKVKKEL